MKPWPSMQKGMAFRWWCGCRLGITKRQLNGGGHGAHAKWPRVKPGSGGEHLPEEQF